MGRTVRKVGVLDELGRIVPTEQIEPDTDTQRRRGGGFAVEPATGVELSDLLHWANGRPACVFTRHPRPGDGARFGARPRIYLRGRRMARLLDVDVMSGTATVQSGISMSELQTRLDEKGFTTGFPTRAWREESLGAVLSAALDAHWGPPYGAMEQEVLGLEVVLPDGTTAQSRVAPRRAVGPDFDRVFLGSRGQFGIVHTATIRIYPSSARLALIYASRDLGHALVAVRLAFDRGMEARNIEILTPAEDRTWGSKRVGLTHERPVLVLVEPWGREASASGEALDAHMGSILERLEPPVGWDTHEGLLPPPREWRAPVIGVPWADLAALAVTLGPGVPPGLWIVRMSRHGAWVSLAEGVEGPGADAVRAVMDHHAPPKSAAWRAIRRSLKTALDPQGVLNPSP